MSKSVGRNDPCTCGSGKKYKKCCGKTSMRSPLGDRNVFVQGAKTDSLLERISGGASVQAVQENAPENTQEKSH